MNKLSRTINQYTVLLEPAEEGGFTVSVPALPGCITEGDTFEQAILMAKDAISGYLASLQKHNEPIPQEANNFITASVVVDSPCQKQELQFA